MTATTTEGREAPPIIDIPDAPPDAPDWPAYIDVTDAHIDRGTLKHCALWQAMTETLPWARTIGVGFDDAYVDSREKRYYIKFGSEADRLTGAFDAWRVHDEHIGFGCVDSFGCVDRGARPAAARIPIISIESK